MDNSPPTVPDANATPSDLFRASEIRAIEKAIRRIVRAHDVQSRALMKSSGLTAAQLVLLKGIAELGEVTSAALSAYADISAATVVTVLDNLEERGLIERYRSGSDRRIVHTRLTQAGAARVAQASEPLGAAFLARLARVDPDERRRMVEGFVALAGMLAGEAPAG